MPLGMKPLLGLGLMTLSLTWSPPAAALTDDELEALREDLANSFELGRLGAGYAALLRFAVGPQISTAIAMRWASATCMKRVWRCS